MGMFEAAARRRRVAEMEQRLAELDEWDRRYGLGAVPGPGHRSRVRRRRRGRGLPVLLALGLVGAGFVYPERVTELRTWASETGRWVLGVPEGSPPVAAGTQDDEQVGQAVLPDAPDDQPSEVLAGEGQVPSSADQPQASPDPTTTDPGPGLDGTGSTIRERLEEMVPDVVPRSDHGSWGWEPPRGERVLPPVDPQTDGAYAFLGTQPGTEVPVGFSPCGPIEVVVNPAGAPAGYTELVQGSLARVSAASGLRLDLVGETDETWSDVVRESGSPVLVGWSTEDEVPPLAGMTAGIGGATYVTGPDGHMWHTSGAVSLDLAELDTWEANAAVLDHELAHVLGLDHVEAPGELMAAINTGQTHFGPGDLAGLARLGAIPCP